MTERFSKAADIARAPTVSGRKPKLRQRLAVAPPVKAIRRAHVLADLDPTAVLTRTGIELLV